MTWSIRTRLAVTFAAWVGVILVLYAFALYAVMSYNLERDFRSDLLRESHWFGEVVEDRVRSGHVESLVSDTEAIDEDLRVFDGNGKVLVQSPEVDWSIFLVDSLTRSRALGGPLWQRKRENGFSYEILLTPFHGKNQTFLIQIVASRRDVADLRHTLFFSLLLLIPVGLAIAVGAGRFYSQRALQPIELIRHKADEITPQSLSTRLPLPPQRDELYFLTETLNRFLERIDDAFLKVRTFTADASHELRMPVTVLKGTLDVLLRKDRTKEEYKEAVMELREEVDSLARLVEDLLTLARADAGQRTAERQLVELAPFIEDVRLTAEGFNNKKIHLKMSGSPDVSFSFDPAQIKRVLLNLLQNAIKYTPDAGEVWLNCFLEGNSVLFVVKDSGPGIAKEEQQRIFDRFYRTDEARSREVGGFGLGLAIARTIAESHGGSLTLLSELGQGSEFRLKLPRL